MQITVVQAIKIVLVTLISSIILVPFIKKIAEHVGAVDIPNKRKVHNGLIPRLGGLAIYLSFLLGYILFAGQSIEMISILIGSFVIIITGIIDDIKSLPPKFKFSGQLIASLIVVLYGGITLSEVTLFGYYFRFTPMVGNIIAIFLILGCINAINLIDGLDGLAAGISSIYFLTIGIIAFVINQSASLDISLTFIMLGSTLGFLVHNFYPARIFMGDSGSMFLGFIISVIALLGFKNITFTSFVVPLLILAVPILDTSFAIVRRLLKHEKITAPDREHLHHQFLNKKISHRTTVIIIYIIDALFAFASIIYVINNRVLGEIIYAVLFVIIGWLVLGTNIISERKTIKKLVKKLGDKIKNKNFSK